MQTFNAQIRRNIELPRAPGKGSTLATRVMRVLLAEDNEVNREVALGMLETLGCTAEVAVNGREAVDMVLAHKFDAVLMDCHMPLMDGFEATAEIRRLEKASGGKRIPIIAMTANAMKGDRETCIDSGMDEYVSKPVRRDTLSEVLAKMMRRSAKVQTVSAMPGAVHDGAVDMAAALETAGGKPDRLKRIFKVFLGDIPKRLAALHAALESGERATAEREAHSIKGAAANIAAAALRASAFEVERACKAGELEQATELVPALAKEAEAVVQTLNAHVEAAPVMAGAAGGN